MLQDVAPVHVSNDVDLQASLLTGWDQHYTQVGAGAFAGSVRRVRGGAVSLFDEAMNRQVYQSGGLPRDRLGFGIAVRGAGASHLCGEPAPPGHLLVFSGASGFEFLSPRDFRFLGVEVELGGVGDPVLAGLLRRLDATLVARGRSIRLKAAGAEMLRRSLAAGLARDAAVRDAPGHDRQIVGLVLDCLADDAPGPVATQRHWRIVSRMRDLVRDSPLCPRTVAEVAVCLGVSRRTLQSACRDMVGISPVRYLRALRLCEVRRAMPRAASVTEVAMQYGFWHLGYFARDYREMFGETPSQTLRRAGTPPPGAQSSASTPRLA